MILIILGSNDPSPWARVLITLEGSLSAFLSNGRKAARRQSLRKCLAMVVAMLLFPLPARPCNQRTLFPSEGMVTHSTMNWIMSSRVSGGQSEGGETGTFKGFNF